MNPNHLRFRINAAILTIWLLTAGIFAGLLAPFEMKRRSAEIRRIRLYLEMIYEQHREELSHAVYGRYNEILPKTVEKMRAPSILEVRIYDRANRLLYSAGEIGTVPKPLKSSFQSEVRFSEAEIRGRSLLLLDGAILLPLSRERVGGVRMIYDMTPVNRESITVPAIFCAAAAILLLLMLFLFNRLFTRSVMEPLQQLRQAIRRVQEGEFGAQAPVDCKNEIGELISAFNAVSVRLERDRNPQNEAAPPQERLSWHNAKGNRTEAKRTEPGPRGETPSVQQDIEEKESGRMRILLVEDNIINQELTLELLEEAGIAADIADNGAEGFEAVQRGRYDAVLMDIRMPEMDGYEATRNIRNLDSDVKDIPIIAMTAGAMKEDREMCLAAGMNDYLSKPINPERLVSLLCRWNRNADRCRAASGTGPGNPPEKSPRKPRSPAEDLEELSAELPGIDLDAALRRLRGNRPLLEKLLKEFGRDYQMTPEAVRAAVERGNGEAVLPLIHTIKGVAGNFSATALYEASLALEQKIRQGDYGAGDGPEGPASARGSDPELRAFEDAMLRVLETADRLQDSPASDRKNREKRGVPLPDLCELLSLVRKNSPRAEACFKTVKPDLEAAGWGSQARKLEAEIGRFDFKAALKTLSAIQNAHVDDPRNRPEEDRDLPSPGRGSP